MRITPWPHITFDVGHAIRSSYVERYWLPSLGPTAYLFLRQAAFLFDAHPAGAIVALDDVAAFLGVGNRAHGALPKALHRLHRFGFVIPGSDLPEGPRRIAVRQFLPSISPKHVRRLPRQRQEELASMPVGSEPLDALALDVLDH